MPDAAPETAKLLLVDDQPQGLLARRAALERPDYELVQATSGEEALKILLQNDFAVILMDVSMPGLDGFQTATLIRQRERTREIPIIFVTGVMADLQAAFRGYTVGAVDYLLKPVDAHALVSKVGVFAALWRQKRAIERAGEALRQAERRERSYLEALYDLTFEEAPIGIGHALQDGHWVRVNARLADIVGRGRDELLAIKVEDLVHPDDRQALRDNIGRVRTGALPRHKSEYRFLRPDGGIVWIALTVSLLRGPAGETVELAIVEDVSEEKRLARALEASERRFARLRDSGLIGIFHERPDGIITEANAAFLAIVGYPAAALADGSLSAGALVAPSHAEAAARARRDLHDRGVCDTHEMEYLRRDGSRAFVLAGAVAGSDGGATGFALDVTATKKAERERARFLSELQESVRVRDDFLYIAAHELRNPLTPVLVQLQNLRTVASGSDRPIDGSWLARQLEPAERGAQRLARLIESLLDVSRLTVGVVPLELEETDLSAVVREVVDRMRPEMARAHSLLSLRAEAPVVGRWDRLRLAEGVIAHLLSNAVKYGAGKPIEIEVAGDEREGRVSVRDHGIGIRPEDRARIFERFGRAAPLHHYGGFGLGLWIARRVVEAHQGRIELWSEPERGSRFTVILPRRPEPEAPAAPAAT